MRENAPKAAFSALNGADYVIVLLENFDIKG